MFGGAMLSVLIIACPAKDVFEQCAMTQRMQSDCKSAIEATGNQCTDEGVYCFDSCVVRDHPQCNDGPCVMFESKAVADTQPVSSVGFAFCTIPCNGSSCPTDTTCRKILSLKVACTLDSECTTSSPWSRCEAQLFCETSRKSCEVDADCVNEKCLPDEAAAKSCTYKFCIPNTYGTGV